MRPLFFVRCQSALHLRGGIHDGQSRHVKDTPHRGRRREDMHRLLRAQQNRADGCLLYTSDAADEHRDV